MKTGTDEAEEGIALADKTVSVLQSIMQGAGANAQAMATIASASEEQMRKGTQAQEAIQEIVRTSEQSLQRIEALTNLAEQLSQETEELEQHLTRFQL
jgi:methyl-accepting chemotaxis protein